ncbi:hypothetical protein GY45DRAFT_1376536 [Cubamyces sp. BRFM 1775]|nr:hypothetical protein GY45DRAFT_1376536 [Cubamyces sp. BRFM 1775]
MASALRHTRARLARYASDKVKHPPLASCVHPPAALQVSRLLSPTVLFVNWAYRVVLSCSRWVSPARSSDRAPGQPTHQPSVPTSWYEARADARLVWADVHDKGTVAERLLVVAQCRQEAGRDTGEDRAAVQEGDETLRSPHKLLMYVHSVPH